MSKACLVDLTRCIGCRACQVACKQWNELPPERTRFLGRDGGYGNPPALTAKTHTRISFHEVMGAGGKLERPVFVKRQCMHCQEPACASACPVTALEKVKSNGSSLGPVIYHPDRCMGCRYCMLACPFNIPTLEWEKVVPLISKCTFCFDRQSQALPYAEVNGAALSEESRGLHAAAMQTPACIKTCPTQALKFGDRDGLLREARQRIADRKGVRDGWQYVNHIYGEKEAGGTSWMYLSCVPFEKIGFRTDLGDRSYPSYTLPVMKAVPAAILGVGAVLGAAYWVSQRKREKVETGKK